MSSRVSQSIVQPINIAVQRDARSSSLLKDLASKGSPEKGRPFGTPGSKMMHTLEYNALMEVKGQHQKRVPVVIQFAGRAAVLFSEHMDNLNTNVLRNDVDRKHSLDVVWMRIDEHSHLATIRAGEYYEGIGIESRIICDHNNEKIVAKVFC